MLTAYQTTEMCSGEMKISGVQSALKRWQYP